MCCPACHSLKSRVVETRRFGRDIYRRRECLAYECGKRFNSIERAPARLKWPAELMKAVLR